MPLPKGSKKRKATSASSPNGQSIDAESPLAPPDRQIWPGWVEMESEPALFNVMLKEMGVRGVKLQEVYTLDEEMLAILPRPVHALIFLFRYRDVDQTQQKEEDSCPKDVWFANQVPEFACASVALLNIVNNIKGLEMGEELRQFRDFTSDMDPLSRGDAIDSFEFVKRIHNSFARENDLLNADMYVKQKFETSERRQRTAKARQTREAKRAGKTPLKETSLNVTATPTRTSARQSKSTFRKAVHDISDDSSPLSSPPDSDADFATPSKSAKASTPEQTKSRRRSTRKPQPRKNSFAASAAAAVDAEDEEGFHFIAYMPINGHVWKLDGLDSYPDDLGRVDAVDDGNGDWMSIVRPALETRMAMYEGASIQFNLMAVVPDPAIRDRRELLENIRELQLLDEKLDKTCEGWTDWDGAKTLSHVLAAAAPELEISEDDIAGIPISSERRKEWDEEEDALKLFETRRKVISAQRPLVAGVRDALQSSRDDDTKVMHCRHDYGSFVRGWLGALAEMESLTELLEEG